MFKYENKAGSVQSQGIFEHVHNFPVKRQSPLIQPHENDIVYPLHSSPLRVAPRCAYTPVCTQEGSCLMDLIVVRIAFFLVLSVVCYFFRPFGLNPWISAVLGGATSALVIVFELRLRALSLRRLLGAVA